MEYEFINEKLAYFRISKTDRVWFFKMGPEKNGQSYRCSGWISFHTEWSY